MTPEGMGFQRRRTMPSATLLLAAILACTLLAWHIMAHLQCVDESLFSPLCLGNRRHRQHAAGETEPTDELFAAHTTPEWITFVQTTPRPTARPTLGSTVTPTPTTSTSISTTTTTTTREKLQCNASEHLNRLTIIIRTSTRYMNGKPYRTLPTLLGTIARYAPKARLFVYTDFNCTECAKEILDVADAFPALSNLQVQELYPSPYQAMINAIPRDIFPLAHGDTEARVRWRASICTDFLQAVEQSQHCLQATDPILWLEDDALLQPLFQRNLDIFLSLKNGHDVASCYNPKKLLKYDGGGFVAVLFRGLGPLASFAEHLVHKILTDPIDWILRDAPNTKVFMFEPNSVAHQNHNASTKWQRR